MNKHDLKLIIYGKISKTEKEALYVNYEDFSGPPIYYHDLTTHLNLKNQIEHSTINHTPFLELFDYDGISLWWFFHFGPFFNDHFFYAVNFVSNFNKLIKESSPNSIQIIDNFEMFDTIKQICNINKIKFNYSKSSYLRFKTLNFFKQNIQKYIRSIRLKKFVHLRIKNSKDLFHKKNKIIPSLNDKLVFAIPTSFRRSRFNPHTEKYENGEHIMQELINLLKHKYEINYISIAHGTSVINDKMLVERIESNDIWIPEEVLLQNYGKSIKQKKFLDKYTKLISDKSFQQLFKFEGIDLWDQIKPAFQQMSYEPYLPYWLNLIDSYSIFFKNNKPKTIFLIAETDAPCLALICNAKRFKIKTIAIQHGAGVEDCEHSVSTFANEQNSFGYHLPDKMLLFGEFWKQSFIKHNYPPEKFEVFGNPSFFELDISEYVSNLSNLYTKYNLDKNKKIILFTTSRYQGRQNKYNFDELVWNNLLENFSKNNAFQIVLKVHPHEHTEVYEKILEKYENINAKVIDGNILELLTISSVLVSNVSTTLVDSICLKKPTIEVEWDDVLQTQIPLKKYGVVLSSKLENLSQNIHDILKNDDIQNSLLKNRSKFLRDIYNIPINKNELNDILEKLI